MTNLKFKICVLIARFILWFSPHILIQEYVLQGWVLITTHYPISNQSNWADKVDKHYKENYPSDQFSFSDYLLISIEEYN